MFVAERKIGVLGCHPPPSFRGNRKVDVRLPGNGNSNSHGARPVHLIITMIQWIRASRLPIKNSLSQGLTAKALVKLNSEYHKGISEASKFGSEPLEPFSPEAGPSRTRS